MKTREDYVRPYKEELEQFVEHIAEICRDAGYNSIDEAYETIMNQPATNDEDGGSFNGWNSAEDYYIMSSIDGIYEFEKEFIRAHNRYDRIIKRLASKNKYNPVIAEELLKMKERDERVKAYLEEANSSNIINRR